MKKLMLMLMIGLLVAGGVGCAGTDDFEYMLTAGQFAYNSDGVTLSWDSNPDAATYRVYRRTGDAEFAQVVNNLTGTTYTDSARAELDGKGAVTYDYQVAGFDDLGTELSRSYTVSVTTYEPYGSWSAEVSASPSYTSVVTLWGGSTSNVKFVQMNTNADGSYVSENQGWRGAGADYPQTAAESGLDFGYCLKVVPESQIDASTGEWSSAVTGLPEGWYYTYAEGSTLRDEAVANRSLTMKVGSADTELSRSVFGGTGVIKFNRVRR